MEPGDRENSGCWSRDEVKRGDKEGASQGSLGLLGKQSENRAGLYVVTLDGESAFRPGHLGMALNTRQSYLSGCLLY